jgi:hypothetical protein
MRVFWYGLLEISQTALEEGAQLLQYVLHPRKDRPNTWNPEIYVMITELTQ